MADRSTLTRGPYPTTGQRPTLPSGRRLPSAPRERKPLLAALALLLVAGGAASSAWLAVSSGHRFPAIVISQELGAGQRISLAAMQEAQVSADGRLAYVPWGDRFQVARYYAAAAIPAGTLLTARMVVAADHVTAGRQVLGLSLKPGQVPAALKIGDHVNVYDTNTQTQSACSGTPGAALTDDAIVTGLTLPDSSGGNTNVGVDIALTPADAARVACNAANGWVAIGVLPAGGTSTEPSRAAPPVSPADRARIDGRNRHVIAPTAPAAPAAPVTPTASVRPTVPVMPASPTAG